MLQSQNLWSSLIQSLSPSLELPHSLRAPQFPALQIHELSPFRRVQEAARYDFVPQIIVLCFYEWGSLDIWPLSSPWTGWLHFIAVLPVIESESGGECTATHCDHETKRER